MANIARSFARENCIIERKIESANNCGAEQTNEIHFVCSSGVVWCSFKSIQPSAQTFSRCSCIEQQGDWNFCNEKNFLNTKPDQLLSRFCFLARSHDKPHGKVPIQHGSVARRCENDANGSLTYFVSSRFSSRWIGWPKCLVWLHVPVACGQPSTRCLRSWLPSRIRCQGSPIHPSRYPRRPPNQPEDRTQKPRAVSAAFRDLALTTSARARRISGMFPEKKNRNEKKIKVSSKWIFMRTTQFVHVARMFRICWYNDTT